MKWDDLRILLAVGRSGSFSPAARVVCRANTALGMEEAVRAGLGVGHLACFGADDDPGFVRIHPPDPELALGVWLLVYRDLRRSARIRVFLDFLAAELARQRNLIEGRGREATSSDATVTRAGGTRSNRRRALQPAASSGLGSGRRSSSG